MYKTAILLALLMSGCSYFTFNATMCEEIASQPNKTVPQECKNYDEKEADKAFDKVVQEKKVSDKDSETISYEIARKIQEEMTYPGQIKVTVIRETRAVNYAK